MALTEEDREAFLLFLDGDEQPLYLLGPFKAGGAQAEDVMRLLLDRDQQLTDAVDWEHPLVHAPYWFSEIRLVTLNAHEIKAMFLEAAL